MALPSLRHSAIVTLLRQHQATAFARYPLYVCGAVETHGLDLLDPYIVKRRIRQSERKVDFALASQGESPLLGGGPTAANGAIITLESASTDPAERRVKPGGQISSPESAIHGRRLAPHGERFTMQNRPPPSVRFGANAQSIGGLGPRSIHVASSLVTRRDCRNLVQG